MSRLVDNPFLSLFGMLSACWQLSCSVAFTYDPPCLAVVSGEQSRLLANVHIALLRLLQMDLEDAHATGAIQASLLVLCHLCGELESFVQKLYPTLIFLS